MSTGTSFILALLVVGFVGTLAILSFQAGITGAVVLGGTCPEGRIVTGIKTDGSPLCSAAAYIPPSREAKSSAITEFVTIASKDLDGSYPGSNGPTVSCPSDYKLIFAGMSSHTDLANLKPTSINVVTGTSIVKPHGEVRKSSLNYDSALKSVSLGEHNHPYFYCTCVRSSTTLTAVYFNIGGNNPNLGCECSGLCVKW